jgi:hypothetical protein
MHHRSCCACCRSDCTTASGQLSIWKQHHTSRLLTKCTSSPFLLWLPFERIPRSHYRHRLTHSDRKSRLNPLSLLAIMRAIHWNSRSRDSQLALVETQLQTDSISSMTGSQDFLNALAAVTYWQAGVCVGLLQGYAYAAAEACLALGFTDVERQLRLFLPESQVGCCCVHSVGTVP